MKKILVMFVVSMMFIVNVGAASKWDTLKNVESSTSDGVRNSDVSVDTIEKEGRKYYQIGITYTIEDGADNTIKIVPSYPSEDFVVMPGGFILYKIDIINKSSKDYKYVDNSINISSKEFEDEENFIGTGFDLNKIFNSIGINRTGNKALQELFGVTSTSKLPKLTDEVVDAKLRELNYNGIEELNKYYLDYLNKLNKTNYTKLEEFDDNTIRNIFSGNDSKLVETNKEIQELGYNWFYNKLYALSFDYNITDKTSENYSIGSYMRKGNSLKIANEYIKETIDTIKKDETKSIEFAQYINGAYTGNVFQGYKFGFYMEFSLNHEEDNEVIKEVDEIIPPKTGI